MQSDEQDRDLLAVLAGPMNAFRAALHDCFPLTGFSAWGVSYAEIARRLDAVFGVHAPVRAQPTATLRALSALPELPEAVRVLALTNHAPQARGCGAGSGARSRRSRSMARAPSNAGRNEDLKSASKVPIRSFRRSI